MNLVDLIPFIVVPVAIVGIVWLRILDSRFKKRIKALPYKVPSMDKAVAHGAIFCEDCRHKEHCEKFLPQVFPDFEHKCGANFTFNGTYYHYTIADKRIPLNNKEDERKE